MEEYLGNKLRQGTLFGCNPDCNYGSRAVGYGLIPNATFTIREAYFQGLC